MTPPAGAPRILVTGVGNDWRGDDGAGLAVARRLRQVPDLPATVVPHDGPLADLAASWEGIDLAILIDAVQSGSPPGTIHRLDNTAPPRAAGGGSTHGFGADDAVALATSLGTLPGRLLIIGIEGAAFETGEGLTPPVARAVDEAVRLVLGEIHRCQRSAG